MESYRHALAESAPTLVLAGVGTAAVLQHRGNPRGKVLTATP
jgi:hypothetical protein